MPSNRLYSCHDRDLDCLLRVRSLCRACEQAGLLVDEQAAGTDLQQAFHQWVKPDARLVLLILDDPQRAADLFGDMSPSPRAEV